MSSILPAVDALLGICNTSVELREAVTTFEEKMGGFFSGKSMGKYGSVSKPCTPGEHQNSW
jgi:hypothetical protein